MSGRKYYCFCDSNCKFETLTKEQIIAAITQMMENGSVGDVDTGFVTKIKEKNAGAAVSFWVGTQAQYNALTKIEQGCLYIITDDATTENLNKMVSDALTTCERAEAIAGDAKMRRAGICEITDDGTEARLDNQDALLYIVEVSKQGSDYYDVIRHTMVLDFEQMEQNQYFIIAGTNVQMYGYTIDGGMGIKMVDKKGAISEGWRITRFAGYR